jgi:hypothetical protein
MTRIPDISTRKCDSCGTTITEGELIYHCRTEIIAGKDQSREELNNPDRIIARALAELETSDELELLDDIYQEIILQLCPDCRLTLLQRIHSMFNSCKSCAKCQSQPTIKKKGKLLPFSTKKKPENDSF